MPAAKHQRRQRGRRQPGTEHDGHAPPPLATAVVLPREQAYKDAAKELCRAAPGKKHATV